MSQDYQTYQRQWQAVSEQLEAKLTIAYRLVFALVAVVALAFVGFVVVLAKPAERPFVAVIRGDDLVVASDLSGTGFHRFAPKLGALLAKRFIEQVRSVPADPTVMHRDRFEALARSATAVSKVLVDYFERLDTQKTEPKRVHVLTVLKRADDRFFVRWFEQTGVHKRYFSAELTYQFTEPASNPSLRHLNPLGFYITEFNWSEDVEHE